MLPAGTLNMGTRLLVLISGFRRDVDEICGLPRSSELGILTREDGTDTMSRNVGK
jgi:hypothetical protein